VFEDIKQEMDAGLLTDRPFGDVIVGALEWIPGARGYRDIPSEQIGHLNDGDEPGIPRNVGPARGWIQKAFRGVEDNSFEIVLLEPENCRKVKMVVRVLRRMVEVCNMNEGFLLPANPRMCVHGSK
jgi:hypothetical protein